MRAILLFIFAIVLLLGTAAATTGKTSGSLPGCRFVVRQTAKWQITATSGNLRDSNTVCAAVSGTKTGELSTNAQIWVLNKVTCNKIDYCTSSVNSVVRCADLGCERAGLGDPNYCDATDKTRRTCVISSDSLTVSEFLDDLSTKWDLLIDGFEAFLTKYALGVGVDFARKLWALKQPVIDALKLRLAGYPQLSKVVLKGIFKEIVEKVVTKKIPKIIFGVLPTPVAAIVVFVDIVWNDCVLEVHSL